MSEQSHEAADLKASSFHEFARRVLLVSAVVLAFIVLASAAQAFVLLFLGVLFAILLRVTGNWIAARTGMTKRWAVVAVLLALLLIPGGFIALRAATFAAEVEEMQKTLPASLERVRKQIERYEWGQATVDAANDADQYLPEPPALARRIAGVFSTTFGALGAFLVIVFLGVCLALEPGVYFRGVVQLAPVARRRRIEALLREIVHVLALWLFAILMSMSIVGVLTGIGLWLLGIPMTFVLALIAFLFAFIPNVGPIIAAAPAVLLALSQSPQKALYVVILYIAVQTVESYFITPFIQRKTVSLPPALTGFVQLVLAIFAGLPGVIIAAPLTATAIVVVRRLYVEDALGDDPHAPAKLPPS